MTHLSAAPIVQAVKHFKKERKKDCLWTVGKEEKKGKLGVLQKKKKVKETRPILARMASQGKAEKYPAAASLLVFARSFSMEDEGDRDEYE